MRGESLRLKRLERSQLEGHRREADHAVHGITIPSRRPSIDDERVHRAQPPSSSIRRQVDIDTRRRENENLAILTFPRGGGSFLGAATEPRFSCKNHEKAQNPTLDFLESGPLQQHFPHGNGAGPRADGLSTPMWELIEDDWLCPCGATAIVEKKQTIANSGPASHGLFKKSRNTRIEPGAKG